MINIDTLVKSENISTIPTLVFIIPYRDRELQQLFFEKHMKKNILEHYQEHQYRILYIHQCDSRVFNRGALKNIGFIVTKQLWPNHYKNMILVFNDIDTMPLIQHYINYETIPGTIKHFYGFKFALGGIFSIMGSDFEQLNGFPNFWAWGYEDNLILQRAINNKLFIDRSSFDPIFSKNILQLQDGKYRNINRSEFDRYMAGTTEGITEITQIKYDYNINSGFVNVTEFNTGTQVTELDLLSYDLTNGSAPFKNRPRERKVNMRLNFH